MFKRVLVPVDVSLPAEARKILTAAKDLAAPWGSELHVMTVVPDVGMPIVGSYFEEGQEDESLAAAKAELKAAVADSGITPTKLYLHAGTVYDRVIKLAKKIDADLILISAHSPVLKDYLLGSNAARIVRHSKRSVLVLRD